MEAIGNWYIFNFLPHGFVWNETYMHIQQRLSSKPHFGCFFFLNAGSLWFRMKNLLFRWSGRLAFTLCHLRFKEPLLGQPLDLCCFVSSELCSSPSQNPSSAEGSAQHYRQGSGAGVCVCLHMGWAGGKSAGLNWAVTHSQDVNCKSALFSLLWPYKCAYWNYLLERHTSLYAHMNLASYGM